MSLHKVFQHSFGSIYQLYLQKIEKKNRTESELLAIIEWLTGYSPRQIEQMIEENYSLENFIREATYHPDAALIKGTICGVKIQEIEDPMMLKLRYLDKIVDELARGKAIDKIIFM